MEFNNREIAVGIWLAVVLVCGMALVARSGRSQGVTAPAWGVIRTALNPKLLGVWFLAAMVTGLSVLALRRAGLWEPSQFKDTLLWFFLCGLVFLVDAATNATMNLRGIITDNLRVIVLLELLIGTYTWSLWAELMLVPLATIIVLSDAAARRDARTASLVPITSTVQFLFGLAVLSVAVAKAADDASSLLAPEALRILALPLLLSVPFAVFVFLLLLWTTQSQVLRFMGRIGPPKPRELISYARRRIIRHCGLRLSAARAIKARQWELSQIRSKEDLDRVLAAAAAAPRELLRPGGALPHDPRVARASL